MLQVCLVGKAAVAAGEIVVDSGLSLSGQCTETVNHPNCHFATQHLAGR
jgi:hypothetical protein